MIGKHLGKWVIERELGRGGMGQVFLAHEETASGQEKRQAAVKILAAELAQDPGFRRRFEREIDALSKLDHPNIVRFYEAGVQDRLYYYVMEYVAGRNYEQILQEQKRMPWREVLDLGLQVCPALKHAHDTGVIHRDIKLQNIMRTDDGRAKLTDFGIAKVFAGKQLTATGGLVGTAEYLSPEQAAGKPVTNRSDLYSFGVVLYTLLTGRPPFQGESMVDLIHKHRFAQFDRPQRLVDDLPPELDAVVCQLLEKDPADRPANGMILHRELDRIRRKLDRRQGKTVAGGSEPTHSENIDIEDEDDAAPGPATLMSRLIRHELGKKQEVGPLGQLFNHPAVIILLFIVCAGVIGWKFWPRSADDQQTLFQTGAALMESGDPADLEKGWNNYLEPLASKHPDSAYASDIDKYRRRYMEYQALHRALGGARSAGVMSEGQRFYQRGLRLCQEGNREAARKLWQNVVHSFKDVESEKQWVWLAQQGLSGLSAKEEPKQKSMESSRRALEMARGLRDQGKRQEAEEIWRGLEELYQNDPAARELLEELLRDRNKQ